MADHLLLRPTPLARPASGKNPRDPLSGNPARRKLSGQSDRELWHWKDPPMPRSGWLVRWLRMQRTPSYRLHCCRLLPTSSRMQAIDRGRVVRSPRRATTPLAKRRFLSPRPGAEFVRRQERDRPVLQVSSGPFSPGETASPAAANFSSSRAASQSRGEFLRDRNGQRARRRDQQHADSDRAADYCIDGASPKKSAMLSTTCPPDAIVIARARRRVRGRTGVRAQRLLGSLMASVVVGLEVGRWYVAAPLAARLPTLGEVGHQVWQGPASSCDLAGRPT